MPWYKSGTVNVFLNSNSVIGVSTAFIANGRVGDAFLGPDGAWYEVTNIASDTAMSISPKYKGPTASGAAYAMVPIQGYPKGLSDQIRDWVNTYGAKMAALGTTGNYDILPVIKGGTGGTDQASSRLGLGAAKSGANNDITSLTGLITALSVAQGGTGVTSIAALLSALQAAGAYGKSNILGAVSQSGGVPTGAIVERGLNANGSYTKFADGRMICTQQNAVAQSVNTAYGPYFQAGINWTFPMTFAARPSVHFGAMGVGRVSLGSAGDSTTASASAYIVDGQSTGGGVAQYNMSWTAIGVWF